MKAGGRSIAAAPSSWCRVIDHPLGPACQSPTGAKPLIDAQGMTPEDVVGVTQ